MPGGELEVFEVHTAEKASLDDVLKVVRLSAVPTLVFDGRAVIALNVQCRRLLCLPAHPPAAVQAGARASKVAADTAH